MNNFFIKIKKYQTSILLIGIISIGIFLRVYNFSDWLFFKGDQLRDLNLIERSVENGPGDLPLLGPKVGGTYLRLGPIFYYFMYFSGLIFGLDQPEKAAYPDLLFSILIIPLFYVFVKKFFSKNWSLILTLSYAVCFFAVQYSRFAWNPNSTPFFNLLFFYSILNFFESSNKKTKMFWTFIAGISYAIASQLHYICLFSMPISAIAIILFQKVQLKNSIKPLLKYAGIILLIFIIFYSPMILSDIYTKGNNLQNFLVSFSTKTDDIVFLNLIKNDIFNFSKYFFIIFSGMVNSGKSTYWLFSLFMLIAIVSGLFYLFKKNKNEKKFFVVAILSWFFSYMLVYIPLGTKVQPRHFLPILPVVFIFWGFIISFFNQIKVNWKFKSFSLAVILFLPVALNFYSVKTWFREISDSQKIISHPRKSGLLKSTGGESWWHLKQTALFAKNDCEDGKKGAYIIPPQKSFEDTVNYAFKNIQTQKKYIVQPKKIEYLPDFCYYFIYFSENDFSDRFDWQIRKIKEKSIGDMSVIRFSILPETLNGSGFIENPFGKKKLKEADFKLKTENIPVEKDIITEEDSGGDGGDGKAGETETISIDATYHERVFIKDLFK